VVGLIFWGKAVSFLSQNMQSSATIRRRLDAEPEDLDQQIAEKLKSLNTRELIFRREPSAIRGTDEFQFKHNLLRDVTYESLLKSHRRMYHAQVSRWLENIAQSSKRSDEFAGLIAEHYDLAQDEERACEWYRRAAQLAIDRYANQEAIQLLSRALELTGEKNSAQRLDLLLAREKIFHVLGERDRQRADLDAMQKTVRSLGPDEQGQAAIQMANFLDVTSDYPGAVSWAQRAVDLAETAVDPDLQARALIVLGTTHWRQGHYQQVRDLMDRALTLTHQYHLSETEADAQCLIGIVADMQGAYLQAGQYFQAALGIARELRDRRKESMALNSLGVVTMHMSDYAGSRRFLEESLEIKYELGDRPGQSITMNNLGIIAHNQGDADAALRYYLSSYELFKELHDREGIASILCSIGSLYGFVGMYDTAGPYLQEGLDMCQQVGDQEGEAICWSAMASYSLATGKPQQAYEQAQRGVKISEEIAVPLVISSNLLVMGDACLALGRPEEALQCFQRAMDRLTEMDQKEMLLYALGERARAHLAAGNLRQAVRDVDEFLVLFNVELNGQLQAYTFGMDSFFQVFYGCCQVLTAAQDERAPALLSEAYTRLMAQADLIDDNEMRRSFLEQVAVHRLIIQEFRQAKPA
jgi:tetratricopeptide (TPR) repeat protein